MFSYRRNFGPQQKHLQQTTAKLSKCVGCGFSSRHKVLVDRHRRFCTRLHSPGVALAVGPAHRHAPDVTSSPLPTPTVCRNYKCGKCDYVTNKAKLFLDHRNTVHGENISVHSCDCCEYASRHKNKVLRHKLLVHKSSGTISAIAPSTPQTSTTALSTTASPVSMVTTLATTSVDRSVFHPAVVTTPVVKDGYIIPLKLDNDGDDRSLDENLRPVEQTNWFVDVDRDEADDFPTSGWLELGRRAGVKNPTAQKATCLDLSDTKNENKMVFGPKIADDMMTSENVFRCRFCRYTNPHKWKMASHVRASHAGRVVYRCPECPRFTTDRRVEWCAHRSRHTGKVVFACTECAYETTMKRNYERHLERHVAGGPRRCGICSYSSTGEGAIQRHMAEYHPPSPTPATASSATSLGVVHNNNNSSGTLPVEDRSLTHIPTASDFKLIDISGAGCSPIFHAVPIREQKSLTMLASPSCSVSPFHSECSDGIASISLPVISHLTPMDGIQSKPVISSIGGRWTCPLCPLSYKRPADLNRHMKQKHEVALKDFVIDRTSMASTAPAIPAASVINTVISSPQVVHLLPVASTSMAVKTISASVTSSSSRTDQPLNLSLKEPTVESTVQVKCESVNNISVSTETPQSEPLDLSVSKPQSLPVVSPIGPAYPPLRLVKTAAGYQCSQCTYVSKRSSDLRRHQLVHCSSKRYRCPHCIGDRSYKLQFDLGRHIAKVHGSIAGGTAGRHAAINDNSSKGMMPVNMQPAHQKLPSPAVSAPALLTTVTMTPSDIRHSTPVSQRLMEGIKLENNAMVSPVGSSMPLQAAAVVAVNRLACPHCQYVGKHSGELERHARLHSGEKPHDCPHCSFRTVWKGDMARHIDTVHGSQTGSPATISETSHKINSTETKQNSAAETGKKNSNSSGTENVDFNMNVEESASSSEVSRLERFINHTTGKFMERQLKSHNGGNNNVQTRHPGRCPLCSFVCQLPSEMTVHLQMHSKLNAQRFTCIVCQKRFGARADAVSHIRVIHLGAANPDLLIIESRDAGDPVESKLGPGSADGKVENGSQSSQNSGKISHARNTSGSVVDSVKIIDPETNSMDFELLAEQYTNEVLRMFYGSDGAASKPATQQTFIGGLAMAAGQGPARRFVVAARSARANRFRPFKCSHCGKRSNWRWDLKKHIRASRHPNADVVELSEQEARESFHEVIQRHPGATSRQPVESMSAVPREHVTKSSEKAQKKLTDDLSSESLLSCRPVESVQHDDPVHQMEPPLADKSECCLAKMEATPNCRTQEENASTKKAESSASAPPKEERRFYTVDRQKLKRLCCSVCPYRSNFRSDVGRHIRHKHPGMGARVTVMTSANAAATLTNYLSTWAHKKFVASPLKLLPNGDQAGEPSTEERKVGNVNPTSESQQQQPLEDANGFEYVDGEDENLPWKCAACDFTDPGKQAVVEHWHKVHVSQLPIQKLNQIAAAGQTDSPTTDSVKNSSGKESSVGNRMKICMESDDNVRSKDGNTSKFQVQTTNVKGFQCDICPYRTKKMGLLTVHKTYHRSQSTNSYKCPHCPYYVCAPRLLHQHVRIHSGGCDQLVPAVSRTKSATGSDGKVEKDGGHGSAALAVGHMEFTCQLCPYVTVNRNDFLYHRQFHRMRPAAPFKCDRCPFWVSQKRMLKQHAKVHAGTQDGHGSENSGKRRNCASQMKRKEEDQQKLCNGNTGKQEKEATNLTHQAGEGFQLSKNGKDGVSGASEKLAEDAKQEGKCEESSPRMVEPEQCSKVKEERGEVEDNDKEGEGKTENEAPKRRRVVHTLWNCDQCPYVTAKRSQRDKHRLLHGSQQRHTCNRCDYSVSGLHLLIQHAKLHNDGSVLAPETEMTATSNVSIEENSQADDMKMEKGKTINGVKMERKLTKPDEATSLQHQTSGHVGTRTVYYCDRCPYSNTRRDHLLCHARFHSGSGQLVCPHCDYRVSKVHLLTQHIRVHSTGTAQTSKPSTMERPLSRISQHAMTDNSHYSISTDCVVANCSTTDTEKMQYMRSLALKMT